MRRIDRFAFKLVATLTSFGFAVVAMLPADAQLEAGDEYLSTSSKNASDHAEVTDDGER